MADTFSKDLPSLHLAASQTKGNVVKNRHGRKEQIVLKNKNGWIVFQIGGRSY
jgi:hypothetical protein